MSRYTSHVISQSNSSIRHGGFLSNRITSHLSGFIINPKFSLYNVSNTLSRLLEHESTLPLHARNSCTRATLNSIKSSASPFALSFRASVYNPLKQRGNLPFQLSVNSRRFSFARVLAKVVSGFLSRITTLGAVGGGAVVAGVSYIQYHATLAGNFALDFLTRASDTALNITENLASTISQKINNTKDIFSGLSNTLSLFKPSSQDHTHEDSHNGNNDKNWSNSSESNQSNETSNGQGSVLAANTGIVAVGITNSSDSSSEQRAVQLNTLMLLTKKMIQLRSLLQSVGQSESLLLPSIVVIGSQSSGKSSVLEAIVGHEFLPKGTNMVTRRPIELTLIHTEGSASEYGEFPALGLGKITDFSQIQKTLTDLNKAVPLEECVVDEPIQLRIYSPSVPDLCLIDLPGYIQVSGKDQPGELKNKISNLCEKYIQAPNIILAVSAADVDLANSTALRASRKVDPRGERTIGVVTKLDLVDAERGVSILKDPKYALKLGYVGVISRAPSSVSGGLFYRGKEDIISAIEKNEDNYFKAYTNEGDVQKNKSNAISDERGSGSTSFTVGTRELKVKLIRVLEQAMAINLRSISEKIQHELSEATYEFKVQYNDRPLSAESYMAENLDSFKHAFRDFTEKFGRADVGEIIKQELDQQVLNLLAQRYWNGMVEDLESYDSCIDSIRELGNIGRGDNANTLWELKLQASNSSLTKSGIGRLATTAVANALQSQVGLLIGKSNFSRHPGARHLIEEASSSILRNLTYDVSDELEICVKPFKYRIDLDEVEWRRGRDRVVKLLTGEMRACESALKKAERELLVSTGNVKRGVGDVVNFIEQVRRGVVAQESGGFSSQVLNKGREIIFLRDRLEILKLRRKAVESRGCASGKQNVACPEVFLCAVADKLTSTADMFLEAELLSKFYYNFPRELDNRLGRGGLTTAALERIACEDMRVRRHIDIARRKELLTYVLKEIEALQQLESREKAALFRRGG